MGETKKQPSVEASDDPILIYFRLSKCGYGSVAEIEKWEARKVLQALNYERFCNDYEAAFMELNRQ